MLTLGGTGADTIVLINSETNQTIVGGNDSSDAGDNLTAGSGNKWIFGNGGDDIIDDFGAAGTLIGGHGDDFVNGGMLAFGNEGADILSPGNGGTAFGGLGDDAMNAFAGLFFGNEGADFINVGVLADEPPVTVVAATAPPTATIRSSYSATARIRQRRQRCHHRIGRQPDVHRRVRQRRHRRRPFAVRQ